MGGDMEGGLSFSVAPVVEDVLQQHGDRSRGIDLESRKAEEAALRRYEAAGWLRKMIGVVAARDLPAEPSEEEFRLGLRSGLILCNILNKVQPGAVHKVIESPCNSTLIPDGVALSAYQYFENVRNFLVAVQDLGLPSFEVSDLEQGGKTSRVVNCVLALESYGDWKQTGGKGVWKFGGNVKQATTSKCFVRKNSEPFTNSLSRTLSLNEKSTSSYDQNSNNMSSSSSLAMLVHAILLDKKPEEVPNLVESVLKKVVEEFEHRMASQNDQRTTSKNGVVSKEMSFSFHKKNVPDEESKKQSLQQQMICKKQQLDIQELKKTLHTTKAGIQFMQVKFHEEFYNIGVHMHGLAHAASGYHRVLEENRKLYNQVQDLKGSIRVYCRVRPFLNGQANHLSTVVDHIEEGNISISTSLKHGKGIRTFNFNKVFGPSATQAEVFSDTQPLIRSVLDGFNVCIFAYGQTGSGKTFTMSGPKELTEQSQGVNYRALHDLFLLAEQRKDTFLYEVSVQMIEIYNEQVRDLLVTDGLNKRLEIRNSSQTGLNVPDANLVPVSTTSDVIYLMNLGHKNRAVGATALNDRSSRSHSCLTVHVQGKDLTSGALLRGCMHLVDLAGSERVNKSEVTGDRLKEAQHINKSLSALGDVIASLAQKNLHVPYRNSKLTQLLQDSLGGQAKTLMFVHISPEPDAVGETISTLKFAERVATVELGAARVNKDSGDVKDLKEQIASLKAVLARKEEGPEKIQRSITGSSDSYKTKASELPSPFNGKWQGGDMFGDQDSCRQPMGDVGNIEQVCNNMAFIHKKQNIDLDEILVNSPPWPQATIPAHNKREEDKEIGCGEWVDKVMVNKHDLTSRVENSLGCWEEENRILPDTTSFKKLHAEQSYNMFMGRNRFDVVNIDDLDDDAATSDSSEPDLLWQFNHAKHPSIPNGVIRSKLKMPSPKPTKSSQIRTANSNLGPSPSRKLQNGICPPPTNRNGRQPVATDGKLKNVHKK